MNNILNRVHELIKISDRQEIVKVLQNLEKYILCNYQMRVFDNTVQMKEIEIYYKNEGVGYIDTTMHGRERQKNNFNNLYLHGAGIDICLSDSEDFYLSILIRGGYVVGKDNCKAYKHGPILLYDAVIPKKANRVPLIPSFNTEADVEHSIAILKKMGVRDIDRFTYIIRNH